MGDKPRVLYSADKFGYRVIVLNNGRIVDHLYGGNHYLGGMRIVDPESDSALSSDVIENIAAGAAEILAKEWGGKVEQ